VSVAPLDIGLAARARSGERESGDRAVALPFPGGFLLGLVDGVGHGPEAALAAEIAVTTLESDPRAEVRTLLEHCHASLRRSRGAAVTIVSIDLASREAVWAGVGNVEALLFRGNGERGSRVWSPVLVGGILGIDRPRIVESRISLAPHDALVFVTDGVDKPFQHTIDPRQLPQITANRILRECSTATDDAVVLIALCLLGCNDVDCAVPADR
jgi:negative regulator of sigma-B (phosphoserine phosphatase)